MCVGQVGPVEVGDPALPEALAHHAVVVEHGLAVPGEPHVALEPRRAQPNGQDKGFQRVLGGVGPGSPVGEPDRGASQRRQPSGHDGPLWQRRSSGMVFGPTSYSERTSQ